MTTEAPSVPSLLTADAFDVLLSRDATYQERDDLTLAAFIARAPLLSDRTYWSQLGHMFRVMASPSRRVDVWRVLFSSPRDGRSAMMDPLDLKRLEMMPDAFTVYRGCCDEDYIEGMNWTRLRRIAEFYADIAAKPVTWSERGLWASRETAPSLLVKGRVRRDDVLLYLEHDEYSRAFGNEQEVVALPEHVEIVSVERL